MQKSILKFHATIFSGCLIMISSLFSTAVFAGDLEWSGVYRAEGVQLMGAQLDGSVNKSKTYGVHTLILRPKIVAADGLYINGQLNIFNSNTAAQPEIGNQLGAYFGNGIGVAPPTNSGADSNTLSENQASEEIRVSQFYLTFAQEYGSLIVGRTPVQFGLGISHNAGRDIFDHYSDTRDLVGYKISMGNFYFFPMYAKISEGGLAGYDDVNELNFHLQYENPESDSSMGVFYQNRTSSAAGNDTPPNSIGAPGAAFNGGYGAKNFNIFFKKDTPDYNVGIEVAQQGGSAGSGAPKFTGFAVALEYEYHPKESNKAYGIKTGYATGDNPKTTDEYEGFIFDRNYDVAMFLFNHGLGQADLLHTSAIGRSATTSTERPDVEAISNVTYFSPYFKHKWSDRWSLVGALTTGILDDASYDRTPATPGSDVPSVDANLGYELDLSLVFNVSEKIVWSNQFGYFEPGDAWAGGDTDNFGTKSLYGFITKAAVSF